MGFRETVSQKEVREKEKEEEKEKAGVGIKEGLEGFGEVNTVKMYCMYTLDS